MLPSYVCHQDIIPYIMVVQSLILRLSYIIMAIQIYFGIIILLCITLYPTAFNYCNPVQDTLSVKSFEDLFILLLRSFHFIVLIEGILIEVHL